MFIRNFSFEPVNYNTFRLHWQFPDFDFIGSFRSGLALPGLVIEYGLEVPQQLALFGDDVGSTLRHVLRWHLDGTERPINNPWYANDGVPPRSSPHRASELSVVPSNRALGASTRTDRTCASLGRFLETIH